MRALTISRAYGEKEWYETFLRSRFSGEEYAGSIYFYSGDTDPICLYTYYYSCCEESFYSRREEYLCPCCEEYLHSRREEYLCSCCKEYLYSCCGKGSRAMPTWSSSRFH